MRWLRRLGLVLLSLPALAVVAVLSAFGIDAAVHSGEVARNVTIDGRPIGGLGEAELESVVSRVADRYAEFEVVIQAPGRSFTYTAGELGLTVDEESTLASALGTGREFGTTDQLMSWATSFTDERDAPVLFTLDPEQTAAVIDADPAALLSNPVEPRFDGSTGRIAVTRGELGWRLQGDVVARALEGVVPVDGRFTVEVAWNPFAGVVDDQELAKAVLEAKALASDSITVAVNGHVGIIGEKTITRWITSRLESGELRPVMDEERVLASLERFLTDFTTPGTPPTFDVVDGEVEITLGEPALACCDPSSVAAVIAATRRTVGRSADLTPRMLEPDGGLARAEALGIDEVVGEFTTKHACCRNRVVNIQRIADLVRGVVIEPGETFSINDFVGFRTRENGFVADGSIQNGHFIDDVGGGISQFATTMFNAAFFAGLDFDEYQSHSIYISRYPYGREATLSFPKPDLIVTNNTPYGMLIWTSYTDTSITVELWSTPYFEVTQTGQSSGRVGSACTRVTTFRERVTPDGEVLKDSVFATYRPGEGRDCNGNPTTKPS